MSVCLRIGLYNAIPDIKGDNFQSYLQFLSAKWKSLEPNIDLDLCVNKKDYSPYGNLEDYLGTGPKSFDLIETDMARSAELTQKVLEIEPEEIQPQRYFEANINAVRQNGKYLGYPTLACGNFIIEVQKTGEKDVKLHDSDYEGFIDSAEKAKRVSKHVRLLGGKIDDKDGWYLPFIYLDGIVDIKDPSCIDEEIRNVLQNNPNKEVVSRLQRFFALFKDSKGKLDDGNAIEHVADRQDGYFYGFSEDLSEILKDGGYKDIKATGVLSPPFGKDNHILVYTDGLVINRAKYQLASEEKKDAVRKFAKFFTSKFSIELNLITFL